MMSRTTLKRIFYWGVLIAFVYFISTNIADIENVYNVLRRADIKWLSLATLLQLISIFLLSSTLLAGSRMVGVKSSPVRAFVYYLQMLFFNVALPFGAWGGMFIFSKRLAEGSHKSPLGAWVGIILAQVIVNLTYLLVIIMALIYLDLNGFVGLTIIVLSAIVFVLIHFLLLTLIIFSAYRPLYLKKFLLGLKEFLATFGGIRKVSLLKVQSSVAENWLDDFNISTSIITNNYDYRSMLKLIFRATGVVIFTMIVLWMLFIAFEVEVGFFQLLVGTGVIYLFNVVSPTPYGIGFVEGAAQLAFSAVGIPKEAAVVIVLSYRGLSVWLPVFIGFLLFRKRVE